MTEPPTSLFSTSWTLHRISPLFHSKQCTTNLLDDPSSLRTYASRLRDTLTGDVLRGVQLSTVIGTTTASGTLDEALAKAGALEECKWSVIPTWAHWNEEQSLLEDEDEGPLLSPDQCAGIMIILEYENITYKAALLCGPDGYRDQESEEGAVTHLPLLLTRMPNALRQEFISFLSTTFDTRVSVLRFPSSFLAGQLEGYLGILNRVSRSRLGTSSELIERVIKETQLTLAFPPPISPALKTLDVLLPRESLSAFHKHGSSQESSETPSSPFLSMLSEYFSTHLAMKLDLSNLQNSKTPSESTSPFVRLTKLSCGAFVLGAEGRLKLLSNPGRVMFLNHGEDEEDEVEDEDVEDREKRLVWRANEELLRALVLRANGGKG